MMVRWKDVALREMHAMPALRAFVVAAHRHRVPTITENLCHFAVLPSLFSALSPPAEGELLGIKPSMPQAAFEDEPQATAAAIALRELGFHAEVTARTDGADFEERARGFIAGKTPPFEAHALLYSSDADDDRFARIAQRHHGHLLSP